MKMIRLGVAICTVAAAVAATPIKTAATEQKDIVVGLKSLPLLTNKLSGDIPMAVVYDPANAASKADAEAIKKIVDGGVDVPGGGKLSAALVGIGELSKLSGQKIAFVTPGLTSSYAAIGTAAAAGGVLTMTTDIDCVKAAKCVIGVVSAPAVTIYFSKAASEAAKIEFSSAFAMLAKPV